MTCMCQAILTIIRGKRFKLSPDHCEASGKHQAHTVRVLTASGMPRTGGGDKAHQADVQLGQARPEVRQGRRATQVAHPAAALL